MQHSSVLLSSLSFSTHEEEGSITSNEVHLCAPGANYGPKAPVNLVNHAQGLTGSGSEASGSVKSGRFFPIRPLYSGTQIWFNYPDIVAEYYRIIHSLKYIST